MTRTTLQLTVHGIGAISPAGNSVESLMQAVQERQDLPPTPLASLHPGLNPVLVARRVPATELAPLLPKHPRLRRASPITKFMVGAAQQALQGHEIAPERLGIIAIMTNACVQYTSRFYDEVLHTPALASPLLFPETVFNAPTSHLAALLGASGPVTTLFGESNLVCDALCLASDWLHSGLADACLLLGAEEVDELSAAALRLYDPRIIPAEGAAALLLRLGGTGTSIRSIHGPAHFQTVPQRASAMARLAEEIAPQLLVTRALGIPSQDDAELSAWQHVSAAAQQAPLSVVGDCMGAASALQLVYAAQWVSIHSGTALVSLPGTTTAYVVELTAEPN